MNWKYPRDEWLDTYKQEQTTYGTISPVTSVEPWSVKAGLIKYHPELRNCILFLKLFRPTVRKNCSRDQDLFLKF